MNRFDGKVALVTGAGRGIGREAARIFAKGGAKVVIADIDPAGGEETAGLIRQADGEAFFVRTDVSKTADVQAMVRAAVDTFGGLDCAINNAMINVTRQPLADIPEEDWDTSMAVNLTAVFLGMKYQIKAMLERGGGAIVNIGSGDEFAVGRTLGWYFPAKAGVLALTRTGALEYAGQNIRINAVGPGVTMTPSLEVALQDPAWKARMLDLCPRGRIGLAAEVAEVAVWLCSDAASIIVGQAVIADGGATLV